MCPYAVTTLLDDQPVPVMGIILFPSLSTQQLYILFSRVYAFHLQEVTILKRELIFFCMQVYHISIRIASSTTDSHLIKNFPDFIQKENSLSSLQNPITLPCTNPPQFSPHPHITHWKIISVISSCFRLCRLFVQNFQVNFICALKKHGRRVLIQIIDWQFQKI